MASVFDDFQRANETPLAVPWVTGTSDGAFNLSSNVAVAASLGADSCSVYHGAGAPTWAVDHGASVKVTVATSVAGVGFGVCLRHAAAARTMYRIVVGKAASNNVEVQRALAGAFTLVGQRTTAWTDGDLLTAEISGPATAVVIKIYRNGSQVGADVTDNSSLASGSPGIAYSGAASSGSLNDWTGYDLPPPPPPDGVYRYSRLRPTRLVGI